MLSAVGAYYWGYICGQRESDASQFERTLSALSNNILFYDALIAGKPDEVKPVVVSLIERDFSEMVLVFEKRSFSEHAHMRCAVTRRFRLFKEQKVLLATEDSLNEYPSESVMRYLGNECEGLPSHTNWLVNSVAE